MSESYFYRLKAATPTRVWVNNPTLEEVDLALEQGAVGCTTNPSLAGGLLRRAPDEVKPVISECLPRAADDAAVATLVQERLVERITDRFRPLYEASRGTAGFVSIQGAPEADTEAANIVEAATRARALAPNACPKIPATAPGLEAFERVVAEGSQTIVTEVFSVSQFVETAERYLRVTKRTGLRPPFFVSAITGIFGDHLKATATREGLDVAAADVELVGVALARRCYEIAHARDYPLTILAGGARTPFDLIGLSGSEAHATINWSTFAEILAAGTQLTRGIDTPINRAVLDRLGRTFDDVRRAFLPDGLRLEDFEGFGPVQHFRNNFISGWNTLLAAIREEQLRQSEEPPRLGTPTGVS